MDTELFSRPQGRKQYQKPVFSSFTEHAPSVLCLQSEHAEGFELLFPEQSAPLIFSSPLISIFKTSEIEKKMRITRERINNFSISVCF
jgi:hypothetical protein